MKWALACIALAGCASVGGGTTIAGTWRSAHVVDTTVTIHDADTPERNVEIAHDDPARTGGGVMVALGNPGYLAISGADGVGGHMALNSYAEYMRGRGPFALGLRVGGNVASGSGGEILDIPVDLLAHVGSGRWDAWAGAGYTPYFSIWKISDDGTSETFDKRQGYNVLAGGRVVFKHGRWYSLTANADVQQQLISGGIRATSVTVGIGAHL